MAKLVGVAAALALLAGCGGGEGEGGLTAEENDQLNNAAAMIDALPDAEGLAAQPATGEGGSAEAGDVLVADRPEPERP